jgi:hypothetical protein
LILKLLNWQGVAGIAAAFTLLVMLTVQKLEAVHWKKQSEKYEQLYQEEQAAFATTVANYRVAEAQAQLADQANSNRVAAEQAAINQRTANEYENRLAAARADAAKLSSGRLRIGTQTAADPGDGGSASVPGLPAAAGRPGEAARQDGLPASDALTATEQAIQLDELIKWVRTQAAVDNNPEAVASHPGD